MSVNLLNRQRRYPIAGDTITYERKHYRLVAPPNLEQNWSYPSTEFHAQAICLSDAPDIYDCQPLYNIYWTVHPEYIHTRSDGQQYTIDHDSIDLPYMANWKHPNKVEDTDNYYDASFPIMTWDWYA